MVRGRYYRFFLIAVLIFVGPLSIAQISEGALHHTLNHVRFMISPEPNDIQDRVQGKALNLTWFRGKEMRMEEIREPAVAGAFYPDRPDVLSGDVKRYRSEERRVGKECRS